jgi:hypothetical protein
MQETERRRRRLKGTGVPHRHCWWAVTAAVLAAGTMPCLSGFAQSNNSYPGILPLPVSMEWSESLTPFAKEKFATDRYRMKGGTEHFTLQYSNQPPVFLSGKKFQGLPGGYRFTDVSWRRDWGTLYGFKSSGYNAHRLNPSSARSLTGAGFEASESLFGSGFLVYLVHAAPTRLEMNTSANPLAKSGGTQIGAAISRKLTEHAKVQAEWTQSHNRAEFSSSIMQSNPGGIAGRGFQTRFEGTLASTCLVLSFLSRGEGLANPAVPKYGAGRQALSIDVRRKLSKHQFQFSSRSDVQKDSSALRTAGKDVREETIQWIYELRLLPRIAASYTWSRQNTASRRELEKNLRVAVSKKFSKMNASLTLTRGGRSDLRSLPRPLWDRTTATGDVTLEIRRDLRLHVRYEKSGMRNFTISQLVKGSGLRFDTRFNLWTGRLSLAPVVDFRSQDGNNPALSRSSIRAILTAGIKLPRYIPGSDLLMNFSSNHVSLPGRPFQNGAELSMRWSFKGI